MENNQNIDQLFRSAFDALPSNQATGSWDTPSQSLLSSIQKKMVTEAQPAASSGTATPFILVGLAMLLTLIGYFIYQMNQQPAAQTTPVPQPAVQELPVTKQEEATQPVVEEKQKQAGTDASKSAKPKTEAKEGSTKQPYNTLELKKQQTRGKD
jgi:hypothetical protein